MYSVKATALSMGITPATSSRFGKITRNFEDVRLTHQQISPYYRSVDELKQARKAWRPSQAENLFIAFVHRGEWLYLTGKDALRHFDNALSHRFQLAKGDIRKKGGHKIVQRAEQHNRQYWLRLDKTLSELGI